MESVTKEKDRCRKTDPSNIKGADMIDRFAFGFPVQFFYCCKVEGSRFKSTGPVLKQQEPGRDALLPSRAHEGRGQRRIIVQIGSRRAVGKDNYCEIPSRSQLLETPDDVLKCFVSPCCRWILCRERLDLPTESDKRANKLFLSLASPGGGGPAGLPGPPEASKPSASSRGKE